MRYDIPLPKWWGVDNDISVGYDYKSANTAAEFNKFLFSPFVTDVDQAVLEYRADLKDRLGYSRLTLDGYYSPGGLLGKNTDADFATFHHGLKSDYYYGRVAGERGFNLPAAFLLLGKAGYQAASTGLLPSEQLYLGGYSMIRGYPENIVSGDEGYYATAELHAPLVRTGNWTGQKHIPGLAVDGDTLDMFGFFDYGSVQTKSPNAHLDAPLSSVGGGVNYHLSQNLVVNASYGFQLEHLPSGTPAPLTKDKSRASISATLGF
jgi:hemolysin activation/secretion protein